MFIFRFLTRTSSLKTRFLYLLIVLLHIPAWGQKKDYSPTPVIPIDTLLARGIIPYNIDYKGNYPRIMPYLYYNTGGTFNEIQGDCINVDYGENSDMNLMVGFFNKYGEYKNVLVVLVAKSANSKHSMSDIPVFAESSQFGKFEKGNFWGKSKYNKLQERVIFVKQLNPKHPTQIYPLLADDVIRVHIGGQVYTFISPEVVLN